ncbi:MAG: NHL repeat-containing protein, partial [Mycobacterium sp.]
MVLVAIIAAAVGIPALIAHHNHKSRQSVLPFTGLKGPTAVAVDSAGDVYVVDELTSQVLKLAAGSTDLLVLPVEAPSPDNPTFMTSDPSGVAVDSAGDVYVAESHNNRVLKLAAGSTTPAVLPFTDLNEPKGVAVDSAGDVYVADRGSSRVLKLAVGSTTPAVLPFSDLEYINGVAVDRAGDVYVADSGNNRVLKLAAGATTQNVLPFTKLNGLGGVAADAAGDVYIADRGNSRVLKLPAGTTTQNVLPFSELNDP